MRVAFLINGLGLGNSTRCHAIIQRLCARGIGVDVITSGNGTWYFGERPEADNVGEIESFYYGGKKGRLDMMATLRAVPDFLGIARRNAKRINDFLLTYRPDAVLIDSVYTTRPMRRLGIPIIALNNSDVIYKAYYAFSDRPKQIRSQFRLIEKPDYYFHRLATDLVLSPTLDHNIERAAPKFRRIDPIVRLGLEPTSSPSVPNRVLIMLSGSVFGSTVVLNSPRYPVKIDVVGREAPPDWRGHPDVTYHGKLLDNRDLISRADLAIVNGGFSAVSEMFHMRKPVVVVPVPNHAEQWVNAMVTKRLGVGMIGREVDLEGSMMDALSNFGKMVSAYERLPPIGDGAAQASEEIIRFIGNANL